MSQTMTDREKVNHLIMYGEGEVTVDTFIKEFRPNDFEPSPRVEFYKKLKRSLNVKWLYVLIGFTPVILNILALVAGQGSSAMIMLEPILRQLAFGTMPLIMMFWIYGLNKKYLFEDKLKNYGIINSFEDELSYYLKDKTFNKTQLDKSFDLLNQSEKNEFFKLKKLSTSKNPLSLFFFNFAISSIIFINPIYFNVATLSSFQIVLATIGGALASILLMTELTKNFVHLLNGNTSQYTNTSLAVAKEAEKQSKAEAEERAKESYNASRQNKRRASRV